MITADLGPETPSAPANWHGADGETDSKGNLEADCLVADAEFLPDIVAIVVAPDFLLFPEAMLDMVVVAMAVTMPTVAAKVTTSLGRADRSG